MMRLSIAVISALGALLTLGELAQIVGLFGLLVGFLIAVPSRRSIKLWRDEAEAEKRRGDRLQDDLVGAQRRGDDEHEQRRECERQVAHLQGEIKTLERYTAQGAIEQMAERMATLQTALVTAITGSSDITLQALSILENVHQALEQNGAVLEKLDSHLLDTPPTKS